MYIIENILDKYFYSNNYNIKRNSAEFLIENKSNFLFEDIRISIINKKRNKTHLIINTEDTRPQLFFFTNFNSENISQNNKKITLGLRHVSNNLKQLDLYLNNYFYYRDILLDIIKISEETELILYNFHNMIKEQKEKNKKRRYNNELVNFPQIDERIGKKYLVKYKKLIKFVDDIIFFSLTGPIPIGLSFYKIKGIRTIIGLFDVAFLNVDNFLQLRFPENLKLNFLLSYLYHYNLFDELYINIQKGLLRRNVSFSEDD